MTFDLHQVFQDIMKEKAHVMSGYEIALGQREARTHIQVDYFCAVNHNKPYVGQEKGIRPFSYFRPYNVIELEGPGNTLNESRFRYHLGRTLVMENPAGKKHRRGVTGLTILAVRKPVKLLEKERYAFKKIESWKYETRFMDDLPVTILLLRELQLVKGGDALAWLQLLEPNPKRRSKAWSLILSQELTGREHLKSTMINMDKEAFMTIADEFREEGMEKGIAKGRVEGRVEGIEKGLLVLRGLLEDGLISKDIFQQRAALLQSNTTLV